VTAAQRPAQRPARRFTCPECDAKPDQPCINRSRGTTYPSYTHGARADYRAGFLAGFYHGVTAAAGAAAAVGAPEGEASFL
jgi:hypothetical protein